MGNIWIGEKVRLRTLELSDIDNYFKFGFEYDTELDRLSDEIRFPKSKEIQREKLEEYIKKEISDDEFWWIIEDLEGNPVGDIETFDCDKRVGKFKFGVVIHKEHWGKGYGKEAIKLVLSYYFKELRYQKVNAFIYDFNERSIKLHESLGFQQEGRLRRMVYTDGKFYDEIYFGMTVEEFQGK